ncbi:unnamed protein product [Meloidogyne enterolobii]|uniref:Uncharacterized protein n=1 Tax=Meloidogyne enterolobii TaxID=390850 RepID=A0ACB0XLX1_MELEN
MVTQGYGQGGRFQEGQKPSWHALLVTSSSSQSFLFCLVSRTTYQRDSTLTSLKNLVGKNSFRAANFNRILSPTKSI